MSGWSIKGITDESTTCDVCGRIELKSVVYLVTAEGDELYAGTTCAARKVGVKASEMTGAVKTYRKNFEIARCDFPDYFRSVMKTTVAQYLRTFPEHRKVAEGMYRRFMERRGFTVRPRGHDEPVGLS